MQDPWAIWAVSTDRCNYFTRSTPPGEAITHPRTTVAKESF